MARRRSKERIATKMSSLCWVRSLWKGPVSFVLTLISEDRKVAMLDGKRVVLAIGSGPDFGRYSKWVGGTGMKDIVGVCEGDGGMCHGRNGFGVSVGRSL